MIIPFLLIFYCMFFICACLTIGENMRENHFIIDFYKELYANKNLFGKICATILSILSIPAAIMLYIIDKIFTICFIIHELGIKKDKKEGTDND